MSPSMTAILFLLNATLLVPPAFADDEVAARPPLVVDEDVPNVPNEDALTKLERLDALSMKTHRQLSVARRAGQPKEALEALERKIETINEQRVETMRKLRIR